MTTPAASPAVYRQEAEVFVQIMRDMAPAVRLDYSAASLAALEQFIVRTFDPPGSKYVGQSFQIGVGCYVGEVIIRTIGGAWSTDGKPQINHIGSITAIFPIQKAAKRFTQGPEESLSWYYETILRYARGAKAPPAT